MLNTYIKKQVEMYARYIHIKARIYGIWCMLIAYIKKIGLD